MRPLTKRARRPVQGRRCPPSWRGGIIFVLSMSKAEPRAVWRGTCKSVVETNITATSTEALERGGGRHALGAVENG